jgi:hypothetical protein
MRKSLGGRQPEHYMGQHFVPQEYLRAFQDPSKADYIWTLPRGERVPRLLPIKQVAQSRDFYDPETETDLARLVESPANPALAKLREGSGIDRSERLAVALYIATMLKRVPKNRARGEALIPAALDSTVENIRRDIEHIAQRGSVSPDVIALRLSQIDAAYEKFKLEPPEAVKAQIRNPRPTSAIVQAVLGMTWRVLVTPESDFFITTDNPAFFHGAYGIGTEKAELRFPLSPTHALHGTRAADGGGLLSFHPAPRDWVREFNRSIAWDASHLAFAHRKALWLGTLMHRSKPYLSRLVWT